MAGPIGHGVARALREAREKEALAPRRARRRRPPRFPWWILITAIVVGVAAIIALVLGR
jgi:hypothetical protein